MSIRLFGKGHVSGYPVANRDVYKRQELAKHPNIVAIKEASGNISQVASIRHLCGDDLDVYSGNDDMIVPILSLSLIHI